MGRLQIFATPPTPSSLLVLAILQNLFQNVLIVCTAYYRFLRCAIILSPDSNVRACPVLYSVCASSKIRSRYGVGRRGLAERVISFSRTNCLRNALITVLRGTPSSAETLLASAFNFLSVFMLSIVCVFIYQSIYNGIFMSSNQKSHKGGYQESFRRALTYKTDVRDST
jgi:hypothetical protein